MDKLSLSWIISPQWQLNRSYQLLKFWNSWILVSHKFEVCAEFQLDKLSLKCFFRTIGQTNNGKLNKQDYFCELEQLCNITVLNNIAVQFYTFSIKHYIPINHLKMKNVRNDLTAKKSTKICQGDQGLKGRREEKIHCTLGK